MNHHPLRRFFLLLGVLAATLFGATTHLAAQDDAEADAAETETAAEAEAAPADAQDEDLLSIFRKGGWAMWILLALSIAMFTLIVFNGIMIREKPFLRPELADELKPAFAELDFEKAAEICDNNPCVVTNILAAGIERVDPENLDPADMKEAMEEASTEELAAPFGMINYLSSIATISPMVGLLGTVSGMIKAFNTIASQGMGQASVLAGNIQEALITTASGLTIALPAMIAYLFFKNQYAKISAKVSRMTGDVFFEMLKTLRRSAA